MPGKTRNFKQHLKRILVAGSTTLAMSTVVSAASAQATVYSVIGTQGNGLNVRTAPSLSAGLVSNLRDGTAIDIVCQTRGDNVVASTMWDKIDQPVDGYVADYYTTTPVVNNPSPGLPTCGTTPTPSTPESLPIPEPQPIPTPPNPEPLPPPNPQLAPAGGGQQITLYTPTDQSAWVCGKNQYDNSVCYFAKTPGYGLTQIHNWWWKGTVTIANYADPDGKTRYLGNTTCNVVPAAQPTGQWTTCNGTPARGNQTKFEKHWWGARIWLRHIGADAVWRAGKATGNFAHIDQLPLPLPGWVKKIITLPLKYTACAGRFINELHDRDAGYGIVMDINWWSPFWTCGLLKVWAQ